MDLTEIRVALARMEERQEAAAHRAKNMDMKLDGVSHKLDNCVTKDDMALVIKPLEERLTETEGHLTWLTRSGIAGGVTIIIGGLYALLRKAGLGS